MSEFNLDKINAKNFSYTDVMSAFKIQDYGELARIINEWIDDGLIAPIKKRGKTSFVPKIYSEYKKIPVKIDYSEYIPEIQKLHPKLKIAKYINNPDEFVKDREAILTLSEYLWDCSEMLEYEMSVNERSYQIWKDEKYLSSKHGKHICSWNELTPEYLNYYKTPEPFMYYDFRKNMKSNDSKINVLIIENKDTWYSIGKAIKLLDKHKLFNTEISVLVYGEGRKATKQNGISDFLREIISQDFNVLYIGDIDREGVCLLYECIEKNEVKIEPFTPLYKQMIKNAVLSDLKNTDDNRQRAYPEEFLQLFESHEQAVVTEVLKKNTRIPQEILNYQDYLNLLV